MIRLAEPVLAYAQANTAKLVKFLVVTGGSVITGLALLALLLYGFDWGYVAANATSMAIMVMPNYLANRYWVWAKRSKNSFKTEVLPFWTMAIIGFVFSTVALGFVESQGWPKLAALVANLVAYGIVWVFKFFVMEKFLFGDEPADSATSDLVAAQR